LKIIDLDAAIARLEKKNRFLNRKRSGKRLKKAATKPKTA